MSSKWKRFSFWLIDGGVKKRHAHIWILQYSTVFTSTYSVLNIKYPSVCPYVSVWSPGNIRNPSNCLHMSRDWSIWSWEDMYVFQKVRDNWKSFFFEFFFVFRVALVPCLGQWSMLWHWLPRAWPSHLIHPVRPDLVHCLRALQATVDGFWVDLFQWFWHMGSTMNYFY